MLRAAAALSLLLLGVRAELQCHDHKFQPDYVLVASEDDITINCESRHSVTVNGTSPGPPLYLTEGQTTWIRVYNRMLEQNLTMHWHGLAQKTAPFSDGTPLVSQWPIAPGYFFDYEIRPDIGDAGTYFYHSHVGFQLLTAHGALIVEEQDPTKAEKEYGKDVILMLGDYYAAEDHTIEAGLLADPFKWSGEPQAVLVQGQSGKSGFDNATDRSCEPHVIEVEPDKLYRLRVIGSTALSVVKMGIEDHSRLEDSRLEDSRLEVVEADGAYTEPVPVDHMQVAPGQRFSYRLRTKSAKEIEEAGKTEFWVRYESRERPESIKGYALLRYRMSLCEQPEASVASLPEEPPVELPQTTSDYLEYKLQPKLEETRRKFPRLGEVTRTVTIQVNQMLTSGEYVDGKLNGSLVWVQNGFAWKEDVQAAANQVPYLVDIYTGSRNAPDYRLALDHGGFDPHSKTFPARVGEVLDIVWQNNGGITGNYDVHPMHIHGEHAWDLGSGNGTYNAEENERRFEDFTPARRDTTLLYRYTTKGVPKTTAGWRAWRVRVTEDNIGAWMMHCHIAQHAAMGMNTVWVFGDEREIRRKFPAAPNAAAYLSYQGDAYGNSDRYPNVNHYFTTTNSTQAR
ncbi:multicopper oxidase domain-containing protein [Hirsutella rhossiliensis]|uniref:Multicopper oxidase domain-containing protein n=1 Tax=Hirsutella rhossiliensis TaxID=111463 RepID=A0A9P8MRK8_9HYPO|nr:multicopper oxidase domain-containing protein [Hirsutella rhossiliensis]KAH0958916.1 multicopper oxidase domain-containing protein [Hirsutella rhossiliensis]